MNVEYLGNKSILEAHKTAFLCSRQVSSRAVLRCYDWATEMCDRGNAYIAEIADCIVFGYIRSESSLQEIFN